VSDTRERPAAPRGKGVRKGALAPTDRRRSSAVHRYRDRRLPLAQSSLEGQQLEAFRSFCRHWTSRYDWSDRERRRAYVALTKRQREELYQRFARECRSWEATLLLTRPASVRVRSPREEKGRREWTRRMREIQEREERTRRFYERLAGETTGGLRAGRLPWETREAFHLLGLQAGAPLDEVRSAYRRLALKHHPDRQGDHTQMLELNWAYRHILGHYGSR
jgi:hypothetical protein